jgi:hypothetical protein
MEHYHFQFSKFTLMFFEFIRTIDYFFKFKMSVMLNERFKQRS